MKKAFLSIILSGVILLASCTGTAPVTTDGETVTVNVTDIITETETETETEAKTETEVETETETEPAETEEIELKWDGAHVKKMTVAGIDISEYTVVYSPDGDKTIRNAASDLAKYINEATGADIKAEKAEPADSYFRFRRRIGEKFPAKTDGRAVARH